jgi:hypothetical protein
LFRPLGADQWINTFSKKAENDYSPTCQMHDEFKNMLAN